MHLQRPKGVTRKISSNDVHFHSMHISNITFNVIVFKSHLDRYLLKHNTLCKCGIVFNRYCLIQVDTRCRFSYVTQKTDWASKEILPSLVLKDQSSWGIQQKARGAFWKRVLVEVSSFVQSAHCRRCLGEVELRCDFGVLFPLLAPGPLVHKGIARPTPSTWSTRIGDAGPDGLVTCIGCGTWIAGESGDRKPLAQVRVKWAEEIGRH